MSDDATQHHQHPGGRRGRTAAAQDPDEGTGADLAVMARVLQNEPDLRLTLQRIVEEAVRNIPGADHAGITQIRGGRFHTTAATDPLVEQVDAVQYETGQGPCLDVIREQSTVWSTDMASEGRWPLFAARTVALGVGSMLSFQLFVHAQDVGALNLYSTAADAFDDADEQTGLLLASHAAVALVGAEQVGALHRALITRDLIGQAKGILIERLGITGDAAFQSLVRTSQNSNRKLYDVARGLVDSGGLEA